MIVISNSPFDITALLAQYPRTALQRQILTQLHDGADTYSYDSENALKFELDMRANTVEAARALNRSGLNFAGFLSVKANDTYWRVTQNGAILLKEGAVPEDAVNDIFKNGNKYATECATAMMMVYFKALLDTYGSQIFNSRFTGIYLMNWVIREPLLSEVGYPREAADVILGDRGYFMNPDVNPETPEWQGENVIVLPDSLFYGHGVGIATADRIIAALNSARKSGATQSAYFMTAMGRPDFKKLYSVMSLGAAAPVMARATPASEPVRVKTVPASEPQAPEGPLVWRLPPPITRRD